MHRNTETRDVPSSCSLLLVRIVAIKATESQITLYIFHRCIYYNNKRYFAVGRRSRDIRNYVNRRLRSIFNTNYQYIVIIHILSEVWS